MNKSPLNVTANTTDEDIKEMVELATGVERIRAYTEASGRRITKFSSKARGIVQTTRALTEKRDRLAAEAENDDLDSDAMDREEKLENWSSQAVAGGEQETPNEETRRIEEETAAALEAKKAKKAQSPRGENRSTYVQEALLAGRDDYDAIADECKEKFPNIKTDRKHVIWYRWQLRKAGHAI